MKLEKRGDNTAPEGPAAAEKAPQNSAGKQKPVLLYLIILFAIAFVLILFSFVMHQRSNAEVLKELQSQVDTLQQLQEVEEKYNAATEENEALRQQVAELIDQSSQAAQDAQARQALELVWKLEKLYDAGEHEACAAVIEALKADDLYLSLPATAAEGDVTCESPRAAFTRIDKALAEDQDSGESED